MTERRSATLALGALLVLLLLAGWAYVGLRQRQPTISDTIGYVVAGRGLAQGNGLAYDDPLNEEIGPYFTLYAFGVTRPGDARFFLGFPPGYPLLVGAGIWLAGTDAAAFLVSPLLALLALLGAWGLAWTATGSPWAGFWAAALLASTPTLWRFGTEPWSDVAAAALAALAAWLYLRSRRPGAGPRRGWLAALGGVLLGYSFFVRYAMVAVLPAFALAELLTARARVWSERWRWPFFALATLAVLGLPLFNQLYYGGFNLTSYSPEHGWYPWPAFSFDYALGASPVGGRSLPAIGETLWAGFGLALLLMLPGLARLRRPGRALVLGAVLCLLVPYAFYAFAAREVNARFLLPALPFLAAAMGAGVVWLGERLPASRWRLLAGLALALALIALLPARVQALRQRNASTGALVDRVRDLAADTPADAVYLSYALNDHLVYFGGRSTLNYRRIPRSLPGDGRYEMEQLEPCVVEAIDALLAAGRPVFYFADPDSPFWGTLPFLVDHFRLTPTSAAPSVYAVRAPDSVASRSALAACRSRGQ